MVATHRAVGHTRVAEVSNSNVWCLWSDRVVHIERLVVCGCTLLAVGGYTAVTLRNHSDATTNDGFIHAPTLHPYERSLSVLANRKTTGYGCYVH